MSTTILTLNDVTIRTELKSGDLGYLIYMHGILYKEEYGYELIFETYVASSLLEFYHQYDPEKDRVWVCEHDQKIIGFMVLMHRGEFTAQLRYFILMPDYRGIGLGKKLMQMYMETLQEKGYTSAYLLTAKGLNTAASLYKRYGFEVVEEKDSMAFGIPVIEQKYELTII